MNPIESVLNLYSELEQLHLEKSDPDEVAKKVFIYQKDRALHFKKKPFGWPIFSAVYRFFTRHPERFDFEQVFKKAELQFNDLPQDHLDQKKFEKIREIINSISDHATAEKKHLKPLPPSRLGDAQLGAAPIPPSRARRPLPIPQTKTATVKISDQFKARVEKLTKEAHSLAPIDSPELKPFQERLKLTPLLPDWSKVSDFEKAIGDTEKKIELHKLVLELKEQSVEFANLQKRAQKLQNDPFFGSFCKNVFKSAGSLLNEICQRSYIDMPHALPESTPFQDREGLTRYKEKQSLVMAEYKKGVEALISVKDTLPKLQKEVKDKKDFLKAVLGTKDEWESHFIKVWNEKGWAVVKNSNNYKMIEPHVTQDFNEIDEKASKSDEGFWHQVFEKEEWLRENPAMQKYFLDEYVSALVIICKSITSSIELYSKLRSNPKNLIALGYTKRSEHFVQPFKDAKAAHAELIRYRFALKKGEIQERVKRLTALETQFTGLSEERKRLIDDRIACNPLRLSSESKEDIIGKRKQALESVKEQVPDKPKVKAQALLAEQQAHEPDMLRRAKELEKEAPSSSDDEEWAP